MGYVYLLLEVDKNGSERHKIGITKNDIGKRIKQLQTGNSNQISLLNSYNTSNYKLLEKILHKKFSSKKTETNNEWFTLDNDEVNNFIKICGKIDEDLNFLKENNYFFSKK
jgi:hypothetical protein